MSEYLKHSNSAPEVPLLLLALSLTGLFLATSCKSDYRANATQGRPGESKTVRQVKTAAVVEMPFGETVTANGTLAAFDQTTVSVKVPGRLRVISVDLGSVVSRGQVIAQLKATNVVAPLDGIVQEKRTSVGEYLAAGAPLVNIVRMDPLRLRAEIPERESHTVRTGQNVRVTVDGDTNVYVGQIMRLSPVIAEQSRMLVVEADVRNNGKLRPGSFAHAEIVTNDSRMAVTIPNNTIVTFAGIEKVIVVQDGKALEKPITTGRRNGEFTEIVAGINIGEKVFVDPGNLQAGQALQIIH